MFCEYLLVALSTVFLNCYFLSFVYKKNKSFKYFERPDLVILYSFLLLILIILLVPMPTNGDEISDQNKVRIVSDFILHSPPGELNEVFNDVRAILNNDTLLKQAASVSFSKHNKDQMTPVKIENSYYPVLITEHNDIGNSRFFDPRSKQAFKYDHLRKEASECEPWEADQSLETWRAALEVEMDGYKSRHYQNGAFSVFARRQDSDGFILTACIEGHQFQPKHFWNGLWRSQWSITLSPSSSSAEAVGVLKVQVLYYEDGNVQLFSSKEVKESLIITSEEQTSRELVKLIEESESEYQNAISSNYLAMSKTTFKALRRQLPITRTKIDWNKILSYSIGKELGKQ